MKRKLVEKISSRTANTDTLQLPFVSILMDFTLFVSLCVHTTTRLKLVNYELYVRAEIEPFVQEYVPWYRG